MLINRFSGLVEIAQDVDHKLVHAFAQGAEHAEGDIERHARHRMMCTLGAQVKDADHLRTLGLAKQ